MNRRNFILSSLLAATLPIQATPIHRPKFPKSPFTLGVASGDPTPEGFVLWTRLALEPLEKGGGMPPEPVPVTWELALDSGMKDVIRKNSTSAIPGLAHSVHVDIAGLKSDREYWYRFRSGDYFSRTGKTKTLPAETNDSKKIRFVTTSCQNYAHGYFVAYDHIIADQPDFIMHLGDYIYDTSFGEDFRKHDRDESPESLEQFRQRHALYKTEIHLQNAHARIPFFSMIDNHDAVEDLTEANMAKRAAAYQAWYEHMPVRGYPFAGANQFDLHRNIKLGNLLQINFLDTRQFRSKRDVCNTGIGSSLGFGNYRERCQDLFEENRTILGKDQTDWLVNKLRSSQSIWNVLASPGPFLPFRIRNKNKELGYIGAWDAYPENRKEIIRAINQSEGHPLILSGDMHSFWALDSSFDKSLDVGTPLTEFVSSSISANWPEPLSKPVTANLKSNNQVKFYNGEKRGYFLHEVHKDTWQATAKAIVSTKKRNSGSFALAKFIVSRGESGFRTTKEI